MQEKSSSILQAKDQLDHINSITFQTTNMVYNQGEQLDIIGDDMFHAHQNIQAGNRYIEMAEQHQHRSRNRCLFLMFLLVLIAVSVSAYLYFW